MQATFCKGKYQASIEQDGQVPCHSPTLLGERVWKYQPKLQQSLQTETCLMWLDWEA